MFEVFPTYSEEAPGSLLLKDFLAERTQRMLRSVGKLDTHRFAGGGRQLEVERLEDAYSIDAFEWDSPYISETVLVSRAASSELLRPLSTRWVHGNPDARHPPRLILPVRRGNLDLLRYRPLGGRELIVRQDLVWHDDHRVNIWCPDGVEKVAVSQSEAVVRLLEYANLEIAGWNNSLTGRIGHFIDEHVSVQRSRRSKLAATGIPARSRPSNPVRYSIPDQRRTPQRSAPPEFEELSWQLSRHDFESVLRTIRIWADSVERFSGVAAGRGEDDHRNALLAALRVRFVDGTGEAFSVRGKTDLRILVQLAQDSATGTDQVFHAECKLWSGPRSVDAAVGQLVGRYSTLRDRLGALIFFVENRARPDEVEPKAVARMVEAHAGEIRDRVAGWPIVEIKDPQAPDRTVELAVVVIDVGGR